MKKVLFYLFLLIVVQQSYAQKIDSSFIEIKYLATFLRDTTNINSRKEEVVVLRVGKDKSIFRSEKKMIGDSIALSLIEQATRNTTNGSISIDRSTIPKSSFNQEVYFSDKKVLIYDFILRNVYAYEPTSKVNWQIVNDVKEISKYQCKKAIGIYNGRQFTAWFSEEIPIPEGPYTFKGLPGLVLEVFDDKGFHHFKMVSIKNTKKLIEPYQGNVIYTEYTKFLKKRNDLKKDPVGQFQAEMGKSLPKQYQQTFIDNQNKVNNYLD